MLGKKIKAARKAKGLSIEKMLIALHDAGLERSRNALNCWEKGIHEPRFSDLLMIAKVLGKPVDYFLPKTLSAPLR